MTSSIDAAGRVQLTLDPALPCKCVVCGRDSNGRIPFVDFNMNLDYYGAITICGDCIQECLVVVDNVKVALLEVQLNEAKQELEVANNELNNYRNAFDSVRANITSSDLASNVEPQDISESTDAGESEQSDSDGSDSSGGFEDFSFLTDE